MTVFNYTVNYVDIAIVAVLLLAAVSGWRRGILITVLRFVRWTAGAALCWYADSNFSPVVYLNYVKPRALQSISEQIANTKNIDVVINNINKTVADLPKPIASMIDTSSIKVSGDNIAQSVLESVFEPALMTLTRFCVIAVVFALFFVVTAVILRLTIRHRKKREEEGKAFLRTTDRLLGAVLGFAKGAVAVMLICTVLALAVQTANKNGSTNAFFETLSASSLYQTINTNNPFIQ